MSVTVKVLCLSFFLVVAFLDHGVAKRQNDCEYDATYDRHTRCVEDPYSEFTDDAPHPKDEPQEEYADITRQNSEESVDLREKNKYDKEQYWNQEDVEVEDDTLHMDARKIRRVRETKHKNHKHDDSSYEVYEIAEEDPEVSEARVQEQTSLPDKFYYKGVQYVRAPEHKKKQKRREGQSEEHYHRVSGSAGSPPASRYSPSRDSDGAETGKPRGHHKSSGGEHDQQSKYHSAHGHKDDKGYKSSHHKENGARGKEGHEKHSKHYDEQGGKKKSNFDGSGHSGEHHEAAHGHKGGKFDEKKAHKKGHNTKGYHNKFHKDEYHKEHKFYDDYHKSGSHERYGDFHGKHGSKESGLKKDYHLDSASHQDNAGKKGHHSKGHVDEDHKGYKNDKGHENHHAHHSDYGKKGGHQGGSSYAYETKH